ncbi:MAG TPA: RNA-directed DNA polymerase, partial [Niabella sp.]|nr:RNA-directed DNA polymerase [Niabella sp.]
RRKFKDNDFLWLMDTIIDSAPGLPIGNFLSQSLSTFYLTGFDHWIKEQKRVKHYFRYVDDIIVLGSDKSRLHELRKEIAAYLQETVKLQIKGNWRVFPVDKCFIDAFGYKHYRKHRLLRKRIKQAFARAVAKGKGMATLASYKGWAKHCKSKHLLKKLLPHE